MTNATGPRRATMLVLLACGVGTLASGFAGIWGALHMFAVPVEARGWSTSGPYAATAALGACGVLAFMWLTYPLVLLVSRRARSKR